PLQGESPSSVWVVRWWAPAVPGLALAAALTLIAAGASVGRRALLAAWLLAAGLGAIWLPPVLLGFAVPLLITGVAVTIVLTMRAWWHGAHAADERPSQTPKPGPKPVVVGLILGLLLALVSRAATPPPATVYLVPGPAVLAPPDLLDSLRKTSARAEPAAGAVVCEARYEGAAIGAEVRWKARFGVFSFRDTGAVAAVALPDVQLLSAEVDGKAALPRAGGEGGRFECDLTGRGLHTLVLRFATPASGERDRETRFAVPELPQSSCAVEFPAGSTEMHLLSARGIQHDDAKSGRIEADLGRA